MSFLRIPCFTLLALSIPFVPVIARNSDRSVLLSNIKSLTLRKDLETTHRRVPAVFQLNCVGGNANGLYDVDIMRCNNQGSDYEDGSIQWTCTASLPEEFKLGSTDVICEGYDSSTDPYILKGSCGVEYRLILTSKGEAKYGQEKASANDNDGSNTSANANGVTLIFWIIFLGVVVWILYAACTRDNPGRLRRGPDHNTFGWGGGGGGPDGDDDDPPPPYDADLKPSTSRSGANHTTQGWRPGFWSGAAAGATGTAAGFLARNHHESRVSGSSRPTPDSNSRTRSSGSGSSFSSARHESTSFGSTSRR